MDREELRVTAQLAMLELNDDEMKAFEEEVSRTLEYFSQMDALDVGDIEGTTHVLMEENRVRSDSAVSENISDRLLEESPQTEGRHIVIPNVL